MTNLNSNYVSPSLLAPKRRRFPSGELHSNQELCIGLRHCFLHRRALNPFRLLCMPTLQLVLIPLNATGDGSAYVDIL